MSEEADRARFLRVDGSCGFCGTDLGNVSPNVICCEDQWDVALHALKTSDSSSKIELHGGGWIEVQW